LNPLEKAIWYLTIGLTAAVLVKLWTAGLWKVYKLFFCYLTCDLLSSLGAANIPFNTLLYANFYFTAQTLKIVIASFLLAEIYSLAVGRHTALAKFGRNAVGYMLAAAGVIPVLWILLQQSTGVRTFMHTFFLFEQAMDGTMAIFLIIISIFMAWFPVQLRRNVIVYIGGFIVWSLSRFAAIHFIGLWIDNKQVQVVANIAQSCVAAGCLLFWLMGLRRAGENQTAVVGHLWNRDEAERLTEQLDAINDSLERLGRR
jgi:hypothetical protein